MKAKRIEKAGTAVKPSDAVQLTLNYVDEFVGRTVVLKSLPTNVKKAKRLFEVDKKYKVQKPEGKYINTAMVVYLRGSDKVAYPIQFQHWTLLPK